MPDGFIAVNANGTAYSVFSNGTVSLRYHCSTAYTTLDGFSNVTLVLKKRYQRAQTGRTKMHRRAVENEFPVGVTLLDQCGINIQQNHPDVLTILDCTANSILEPDPLDVTGNQFSQSSIGSGNGYFTGSCGFPDLAIALGNCRQVYTDLQTTCQSPVSQFVFVQKEGLCISTAVPVDVLATLIAGSGTLGVGAGWTADESSVIAEEAAELCYDSISDVENLCRAISQDFSPDVAEEVCDIYDSAKNGLRHTYITVYVVVEEADPDTDVITTLSKAPDPGIGIFDTVIFTFDGSSCGSSVTSAPESSAM